MTSSNALQTGRSCHVLKVALVVACLLQVYEIRFRGIDPDEFEHLHALYLVYRGDVPYRDFFEHHGPALYYVLQPAFLLFGAEMSTLWFARLLLWFCSLGTLTLAARIAQRILGPPAGLVAATLLAWTTVFQLKGIELRPDVPATLLVTAAAAMALDAPLQWRRWLTIGLFCGMATLFTQKSIVPIAGITLAAITRESIAGRTRHMPIIPAAMCFGGAIVWTGALVAFALVGAQGEFLYGTVEQLLVWPVRSQRWEHLRPTLAAEPVVWIAGLIEIVAALRSSRQGSSSHDGRLFTSIAVLVSIASLGWVKATYAQYYLLWFPLLTALAACRLVLWSRMDARKPAFVLTCVAGGVLILAQAALAGRAFDRRADGALPHLSTLLLRADGSANLIFATTLIAAVAALWWCARRRHWPAMVAIVAGAGMIHAILRDVDAALWSNSEQVRRIELLGGHVGPNESVFDGYTGYGALRPHAYYYWWLNEYSLALMSEDEREAKLLAKLEANPPAAVLFDENLARLPDSVTVWITRQYGPEDGDSWLWLPRQNEAAADK